MTASARHGVLVIHPGALGDVLQAVPALRALAALDGGARVSLAAQPRLAALLVGAGAVDEALSFDALGLEALFADAPVAPALADRLARAHAVVSWFGARQPPYPERLRARAPRAIVALPVPEVNRVSPVPVWRHLLASLAPLGVSGAVPAEWRAPLAVPADWRARARATLSTFGLAGARPILVAHAGAGGEWKRWPVERFADAIARAEAGAPCALLLHEGPADGAAVAALEARLDSLGAGRGRTRVVAPDLPVLAGLLAEARAFLGGDSGVSHLAAAVGVTAVIVFPEATRQLWQPWSASAVSLGADEPTAPNRAAERLRAWLAGGPA
ncbi:MAG TPA: glycosyltransferase family 9 protein [Methylomirabilota bacterium]|nr:glycosyltransferase family 9 protein [Methylomirabilota bacterium]